MTFRHFKTIKEAKAFIATKNGFPELIIVKKKRKHPKPFSVGTRLSFLHFDH